MYSEHEHDHRPYRAQLNPAFRREALRHRKQRAKEAERKAAADARKAAREQASKARTDRREAIEKERNDLRRRLSAAARNERAANEEVERLRAEIVRSTAKRTAYSGVESRACYIFGVTRSAIRSNRRSRDLILAKQFVMYWTARLTDLSYPTIGRLMGGKDHTTILHGKDAYVAKRAAMGRTLRRAR